MRSIQSALDSTPLGSKRCAREDLTTSKSNRRQIETRGNRCHSSRFSTPRRILDPIRSESEDQCPPLAPDNKAERESHPHNAAVIGGSLRMDVATDFRLRHARILCVVQEIRRALLLGQWHQTAMIKTPGRSFFVCFLGHFAPRAECVATRGGGRWYDHGAQMPGHACPLLLL